MSVSRGKLDLELVGDRPHALDPPRDPLSHALVGEAVHEAAEGDDALADADGNVVVPEAGLPIQHRDDVLLDVKI